MSGRRRLRTRYEPEVERDPPPVSPAPPPPATPAPAAPSEAEKAQGSLTVAVPPPQVGGEAPLVTPSIAPSDVASPALPPLDPFGAAGAAPIETPRASPVRRQWRRVRATLVLAGIATFAFATGIVLFNSVVMPRLIHGVGQVDVPDLANLTLEQAEQTLRPLSLQLSRAGEHFDPAVPRGFILSQDPPAGIAVRGGRRISVVVSLGEEFSSVPELFGESQRSAEQLLKSAGLRVGVITRAPSDDVGEGMVAGSDPGPETVLPRDGTVSLLISSGAGEEMFVMPDLLGREVRGVRRQLEAHGLHVVTGARTVGTIIGQTPAPGSRITRSTRIVLQASGRLIR